MKAYQQIEIRSRRFIDVEKLDTSTELLGAKWEAPIFLCPGLDTSRINTLYDLSLTWDFVKRLKDATQMKLVLKGIVTREDAEIAPRTWRGGDRRIEPRWARRGDASPPTECLPDVVAAGQGRVPVLVDGGVRRGTDVFKALALGAAGVGFGRPQAWRLAAFWAVGS